MLIGVPFSYKLPGARLGPRLFRMEVLVSTRGVAGGDQTVRQNPEAGKKDVKMIASRLHFRLRRQWAGPGRAPLSWCRGQDRPFHIYKLCYIGVDSRGPDQAVAPSKWCRVRNVHEL